MGYQTIAPGGHVREHSHGDQVELQICFSGRGRVVVDGVSHPLVPGTACFLGYDVKHSILNEGSKDPGSSTSLRRSGGPGGQGSRRRRPLTGPRMLWGSSAPWG
jgi:hypothetical protein